MKTNLYLLLLLSLFCIPRLAPAQGTAIGYQGVLNDGGLPATGLYDFNFTVFDVAVDGAPLAATVVLDAVPVTNGAFNVALDFGPDIFTGPARWLEIAVRNSGLGDLSILTPRTPLLPAPYSIFAGQAGAVASGTVTADRLNTGGVPPLPGQFLSYDGGSFVWSDPGVPVGDIFQLNGSDAYYNGGKVGIGTLSPASKLTVVAAGYGIEHTDGTRRLNTYVSASGGWLGTLSNDPLNFYVNGGGSSMTVTTGGRVGIGTTTPGSKLTVRTTGTFSAYGIEHTDGNVRLSTYLDAGYGGWIGTRSAHPFNLFVNDGLPSLTIDTGGATILTPLGGYGSMIFGTPNGESGMSIRGGNRADVRFNGSTLKLVAAPGVGPPSSMNGIAVHTSGNVGIGTDTPLARLDVRGTTRTCVLTITGGCDLAEPFPMNDENISKGSVVVIDDEHPGRLMRSVHAYDRRVAGIISGANGVNPGITLQQEGVFVDGQNVALSGRVYVLADARQGAIKPGDLLTTSETPGHAMRAEDQARSHGAILGKAMSELKEGRGMVLVLVTLQ